MLNTKLGQVDNNHTVEQKWLQLAYNLCVLLNGFDLNNNN